MLRMSDVAARREITSASTAKIAPFLDRQHPDREEACKLFGSLFYGSGGDRYTFKMSEHALGPLLALAPDEPAARHALASAAGSLWRCQAYPETRACIEALLPFEAEAPWAQKQFRLPWRDQQPSSLTGPRQLALLHLYRAECLLAAGESAAGEDAFTHALELAKRAQVPSPMQLSPSTGDWGTLADFRIFALTRAARALRLQLLGKDACLYRKIPKSKRAPPMDPALLATANRYAEEAESARRSTPRDTVALTGELYRLVTTGKHKQARTLARAHLASGDDGGPMGLGPDAWTNVVETFIRTNDMKTDRDLFDTIFAKLDPGEPAYIGAPSLVSNVCHVLNTLERFDDCVALVDRCFAALGTKPMQLLDRKLYAVVNGDHAEADELVRDVMESPERWQSIQPRGTPMAVAACWYAKKRDRVRLMDALKLAKENGYRDFSWAKDDPGLAYYLDDPEVRALL